MTATTQKDAVASFVEWQLKRSIRVLLDAECWSAATVLVYSGIDTMAWIGMPASKQKATRKDFIQWAETYLSFSGHEQLSGPDLYGARCAMLHQFGADSDLSNAGQCRLIGYMTEPLPEIIYRPEVDRGMVLVSVPALAQAFFRGVDSFLVRALNDPASGRSGYQPLSASCK